MARRARAAIAGSLLESLDTEVDEDAEAAWATEVNRRVAELDSGAGQDHSLGRSSPPTRRALMPLCGLLPEHVQTSLDHAAPLQSCKCRRLRATDNQLSTKDYGLSIS